MKNISKVFGTLKSTLQKIKDTHFETNANAKFYQKVEAQDAKSETPIDANVTVEDRNPHLDRVLLKGFKKTQILTKIEEIVLRSKFTNIPNSVKDACEIVHYHVMNDLPVRVTLVKMIMPDLDIRKSEMLDEQEYEEWLRYKHNMDATDSTIDIEDTYGMNVEGGRGKAHHENWKINRDSDSDSWKKH